MPAFFDETNDGTRRKTWTDLDGVYCANVDARDGHTGEDMTSNLEDTHGERVMDDGLVGSPQL